MVHINASLLEKLQGVIERTYDLETGVRDIGRFVIGDEGYRRIYGPLAEKGRVVEKVGSPAGARTLVRPSDDGALAVSIYYPDSLIACLERNDPTRRLDEANIDAFGVLVEELDHLLVIADRYHCRGVSSLLDLELHANVTKYLVLALFVGRMRGAVRLRAPDAAWIRWHLFGKWEYAEPDPEVAARYRDARRLAARYLSHLEILAAPRRLAELRRFHRLAPAAKVARIAAL